MQDVEDYPEVDILDDCRHRGLQSEEIIESNNQRSIQIICPRCGLRERIYWGLKASNTGDLIVWTALDTMEQDAILAEIESQKGLPKESEEICPAN